MQVVKSTRKARQKVVAIKGPNQPVVKSGPACLDITNDSDECPMESPRYMPKTLWGDMFDVPTSSAPPPTEGAGNNLNDSQFLEGFHASQTLQDESEGQPQSTPFSQQLNQMDLWTDADNNSETTNDTDVSF